MLIYEKKLFLWEILLSCSVRPAACRYSRQAGLFDNWRLEPRMVEFCAKLNNNHIKNQQQCQAIFGEVQK